MKKHTKVIIYHDPITRQEPEGKALLLRKVSDEGSWEGKKLERWKVCFEGEDGGVYERRILA